MEIELERTFLVKKIPSDMMDCEHVEIRDLYIPRKEGHPILRIRKRGESYEITKKTPVEGRDSSCQYEHTIKLSSEEFEILEKAKGRKIRKLRYFYPSEDHMAEIGIFQDELKGLVLADFEFKTMTEKDNFKMPDFCLADVTQELPFAGGFLAGMKYNELEEDLKKYNYKKIIFDQ
ncbi:MAG: CYTH domain-containing protein [Candidatus Paceibacterota bacterium]|jgi:CYTH domain-containing protein